MANILKTIKLPGAAPAAASIMYSGAPTAPAGIVRANVGPVKPITPGRNVLQYLREQYPGMVITESKLRVEVLLNNQSNQYQFNILQNPGVDAVTEVKLDKNDIFGFDSIGFYLTQRTLANPGNEELLTFPSNSLLDSTNVTVKDFYCIYNGSLQIAIGTNQIYPVFPMERFLYVPVTQKDSVNAAIPATSAWTSPTTGVGTYGPFENQRDEMSSQVKLHNILQLSGAAQNIIQVNVPAFSGMKIATVTSGIGNYLVMLAYGYIIKNAGYRGQSL